MFDQKIFAGFLLLNDLENYAPLSSASLDNERNPLWDASWLRDNLLEAILKQSKKHFH